ncbi:MAG: hypothetical protein ACPGRE_02935 [Flavobacteriaceae bacterium]
MKLFGLDQIVELRLLNFGIVFWGINRAIKLNITENSETDYLSNFGVAMQVATISLLMIVVSLSVYLNYIDPNFLEVMEETGIWGSRLSVLMVTFGIAVEGFASSVITSFILMQYWKQKSYDLVA